MSNNLDPGQARRFVAPDLNPNCVQMLSADDAIPGGGGTLICSYIRRGRVICLGSKF